MGLVDPSRAVVRGGSAGGYTTLQIATTLGNAFAAGAPQYGISEMRLLDEILHKFEYYLCDRLMGGPYVNDPETWKERSPIYHVDKIKMPLLVRCILHSILRMNILLNILFSCTDSTG